VEPYYANNNNSSFAFHLFSRVPEFIEAKNLPLSNLDPNLVNFLSRGASQKNYIVKRPETLMIAFCYTAGSDKPGRKLNYVLGEHKSARYRQF